jgi:NTP pyrophosphatase (non-canonical NTP hydrolase)
MIENVSEYQKLAMRTLAPVVEANDPNIFADPRSAMIWNAASGLASETGEINEILKKVFFHGHEMDTATVIHLKKETGDLLWYIALLCHAMGWNMADVLQTNIDKLRARYPEGFSTERSINRAAGDI